MTATKTPGEGDVIEWPWGSGKKYRKGEKPRPGEKFKGPYWDEAVKIVIEDGREWTSDMRWFDFRKLTPIAEGEGEAAEPFSRELQDLALMLTGFVMQTCHPADMAEEFESFVDSRIAAFAAHETYAFCSACGLVAPIDRGGRYYCPKCADSEVTWLFKEEILGQQNKPQPAPAIPPQRDGDPCPTCNQPFLGYTTGEKCETCGNFKGDGPESPFDLVKAPAKDDAEAIKAANQVAYGHGRGALVPEEIELCRAYHAAMQKGEGEMVARELDRLARDKADLTAKLAEAEKERDAIQKDYDVVDGEVSRVYDSITCGKFSKPNTRAQAIIDEVEERTQQAIQEELSARGEGLTEEDRTWIGNWGIWIVSKRDSLEKMIDLSYADLSRLLSIIDRLSSRPAANLDARLAEDARTVACQLKILHSQPGSAPISKDSFDAMNRILSRPASGGEALPDLEKEGLVLVEDDLKWCDERYKNHPVSRVCDAYRLLKKQDHAPHPPAIPAQATEEMALAGFNKYHDAKEEGFPNRICATAWLNIAQAVIDAAPKPSAAPVTVGDIARFVGGYADIHGMFTCVRIFRDGSGKIEQQTQVIKGFSSIGKPGDLESAIRADRENGDAKKGGE